MKYLKIQNNGLLDIRLVALMGGTTKANDKYKIGQFGTGLKYTLAYLYRENIDFKIFSGEDKINISTEKEVIKDTEFEIICIEGHRTSITTSMGMQWNAWMIIRELWCNALDEGGHFKAIVSDENELSGAADKTTFYIQINAGIQQVITDWQSYFIHDFKPMWENDKYAIYENTDDGNLKLYKHGVLIYQHAETKSLFNYDIKMADINELREFRGHPSIEVCNALEKPNSEVISYFLQNIKEEHYEGSELEYDWFGSFASIWKDTIGNSKIATIGDSSYYSESGRGVEVDFSNVLELPKKIYKALVKKFDGIGALVMVDEDTEFFEIPCATLEAKVMEAVSMLGNAGYEIQEDIKIRFGMFRDGSKKAASNRSKKQIMFSEVCLKMEYPELCSIIVENVEYIKFAHKHDSFLFTKHFIDLYTRTLLATNQIEV